MKPKRLLLDTHALLWSATEPTQLSDVARASIEDPETAIYISMASAWEITIKHSLGKLLLPMRVAAFIERAREELLATLLPIELEHLEMLSQLPFHHRDPFDRLLIAQALSTPMPVISTDNAFDSYDVPRVW